jgi:hypothetical protein
VPTPRTKSGSSHRGWLALPCRTLARPAPTRTQLPPRHSHVRSFSRPLRRHTGLHAALTTTPPKWISFQAPLLRFFQRSPLHRHHAACPLPVARGPRLPHLERGPPLPFFTTTTVYSKRRFAGLLRPATDHGVHPVLSLLTTAEAAAHQTLHTSAYMHPSELFPFFPAESRHTDITAGFTRTRSPHVVAHVLPKLPAHATTGV